MRTRECSTRSVGASGKLVLSRARRLPGTVSPDGNEVSPHDGIVLIAIMVYASCVNDSHENVSFCFGRSFGSDMLDRSIHRYPRESVVLVRTPALRRRVRRGRWMVLC